MDDTRVSVKPLWARIQGENRPFSAGTTYEISCEVVGARPTPTITWSKGSMMLRNVRQMVILFLNKFLYILYYMAFEYSLNIVQY